MIMCRPLAPPRLLAVAPPVCARAPCSPRPPSLSLRVVRCMAKEKRVRMVAKQIQRELADMLTRDPVLQRAVLPEAALGADRYLSSLTTIADVELSNDLQVCKVYVSVFGDERGKKVAIEGLKARTKYVRSQIGKRMKLRLTPEIRFIEDESMERGSRISSDNLAWPFLKPVDVKALQLDDYYKIITKPMDFSTIEKKMEGKDGTKYSSVREICSDVRLIFTNAMKYNDEQNDFHIMAKSLLENFEEKWLHFLPKVETEEKRQKEPKNVGPTNTSREESIAKLVKDTDEELNAINKQLEELRKMVVQRSRKMTTDEKRKLGAGLCHLSSDDLNKALEIVAQDNPIFQNKAEEVDLDMDAQSETTLWRLKFFVREVLERQANAVCGKDEHAKRKREIVSALSRTQSKRLKKQP